MLKLHTVVQKSIITYFAIFASFTAFGSSFDVLVTCDTLAKPTFGIRQVWAAVSSMAHSHEKKAIP